METIENKITISTENLDDQEADKRITAIRGVVHQSGLVTDSRHDFRLTPDRLVLNSEARNQFEQIGELILSSFSATRRVFLRAKRSEFPEDLNRFVIRALEAGMSNANKKTLSVEIDQLPLFFRADCILAQDGGELAIKATEIEGERSIAFGFASFIDQINTAVNQVSIDQRLGGLGVASGIKQAVEESNFQGKGIALILAEDQLFYLPEQALFVNELRSLGIPVELVRENDFEMKPGNPPMVILPSGEAANVAVSLPKFNPQKSGQQFSQERLRMDFIRGAFDFLLPPFKFFGTKSSMALMHQPIIRDIFFEEGMNAKLVDKLIPPTKAIAGQISEVERLLLEMGIQTDPPTLLKAVGMTAGRGMAMPNDREGIREILRIAKGSPFDFITQQFLETVAPEFRIFDSQSGELRKEFQFMRLAAFFANINGCSTLLGVEGTGLPNPFVHGNPNCIFFPVVFKEEV
ncbi:hypothetical protein HY386_01840 [Candidatus Daviesbacteria bacterium]|nr:hypothetical protein [Candidatus Daviesbacteria bacterium]